MENKNNELIKNELLDLSKKIMDISYSFCENENSIISELAININNNAYKINKLASKIST